MKPTLQICREATDDVNVQGEQNTKRPRHKRAGKVSAKTSDKMGTVVELMQTKLGGRAIEY